MRETSPDYFSLVDDIEEDLLTSIPLPGNVDTTTSAGASESNTLSSQPSTSRDVDVDILHPGVYYTKNQ